MAFHREDLGAMDSVGKRVKLGQISSSNNPNVNRKGGYGFASIVHPLHHGIYAANHEYSYYFETFLNLFIVAH
jgi:hypothetical protein